MPLLPSRKERPTMKTSKQWIDELKWDANDIHPLTCGCNRCNNGYDTFLLPEDISAIQSDARADLLEQNAKMREILDKIPHDSCGQQESHLGYCPACRWNAIRKEMNV